MIKPHLILLLVTLLLGVSTSQAQEVEKIYSGSFNEEAINRENGAMVTPSDDDLTLATDLALRHYPELQGHKIKIVYRPGANYPITAGYPFGNIFRLRKNHVYTIIVHPNTFVKRISLNKRVGVIGHEMAHFVYYKKRPPVAMIWWGLQYVVSKKFRYKFESDADYAAIDHGLGLQLLDLSMYINTEQVRQYMLEKNYPLSSE